MQWRNSVERYGAIAKILHWVIGIGIILMMIMGWTMGGIPNGPDKFWVYSIHKATGITILALVLVRIVWKLINWDLPRSLPTHKTWEKKLAYAVHFLLYALIIIQPLSGWILTGAANSTINWFGFFPVPNIAHANPDLKFAMAELHEIVPWAIIGLLVLHIAGALKHALIDVDDTLKRMVPFGALLLLLVPVMAHGADAPKTWQIDRKLSTLTFEAIQEGSPFKGKFGSFDGQIFFDQKKPEDGKAQITIDLGSIVSGNAERDSTVRQTEWFDIAHTPTATYTIDSFVKGATEGSYTAKGRLALRGIEKPLDLPFRLTTTEGKDNTETAHAVGQTTLKRLDFGVGDGPWSDPSMVGLDIKINVDITATAVKQ